ncbi:type II toxin-antitoxin system HicB family antitoxin [cf. Phormidesmis sp. LEGE 11477]|uniref:type II toxin-antitoxin system HicB family antitoxin n=1 Tax=cf. Phormidesmis sp. LEGE 11477 TaxID=1828680 RepID=UPI001D13C49A|nr:type II toxin-antitoxin system HicB family antitoxin [cf. Phormidesmis sp. LEGE 11477]
MIPLQQNIHAVIWLGEESGYCAECLEIAVVTQGSTLDETSKNLGEAVSLYLEGENPSEFGLVAQPSLSVSFELLSHCERT